MDYVSDLVGVVDVGGVEAEFFELVDAVLLEWSWFFAGCFQFDESDSAVG